MRFLRPTASVVTGLALLVGLTGVAQAQESSRAPPADARWHEPDEPTTGLPPAQTIPPAAPVPALPAEVGGQTVLVHLVADSGLRLEVYTSVMPRWSTSGWQAHVAWSPACEAPCDRRLPLGHEYRLVGPAGVRASRPFSFEASPGQTVLLTATAASQDAFTGGVALVVLGSLAIPGGLLVTLTGAVQGLCIGSCPPNGGPGPDVALEVAGGVIAITGVVALVGGILLVHGNARSGQTQDILFPKPPEHQDTAWLRAPVWNDSVRAGPAGAARVGVPIFSRRF